MISAISHLHSNLSHLHCDIKLDNWGVKFSPFHEVWEEEEKDQDCEDKEVIYEMKTIQLVLIDFGKVLPIIQTTTIEEEEEKRLGFIGSYSFKEMECPQMRLNLPWSFQIDLFSIFHCTVRLLLSSESGWNEEVGWKEGSRDEFDEMMVDKFSLPSLTTYVSSLTFPTFLVSQKFRRYRDGEFWRLIGSLLIGWTDLSLPSPYPTLLSLINSFLLHNHPLLHLAIDLHSEISRILEGDWES